MNRSCERPTEMRSQYYYYYYYYYYYLLLLLLLLSRLCRVFTITYLKQTMYLGYIVLQLFYIDSLCYMYCDFAHEVRFVLLH